MSGPLTVQVVKDQKSLARFVELPWQLYKSDPLWIAPLRRDARRTSDPVAILSLSTLTSSIS